jgi:hypothetical protein
MAKIWLAREGTPLQGPPFAEKPLQRCIDELGLRRGSRLASSTEPLVIGRTFSPSAFGPRYYVAVELDEEASTAYSQEGWKSGYYLVLISVEGLKNKLAGLGRHEGSAH